MSWTKNSPNFDRMMEEARHDDDLLDQRYAEELFCNSQKGRMPPVEKLPLEEKPTAANVAQQPKQ